ncbi:MAG: GGDEF domain-containing protein, partial [Patescibacteria group bacterium]
MSVEKAAHREMEKKDAESRGITAEEKEDYIDERTAYRNEYDEKLEKQITTDELTGLANRQGFVNELEKALVSMHQPRSPLSEERRSKEQVAPALEEFSLLFI